MGKHASRGLQVTLFEASMLVLTYLLYILLMVFNNSISEWVSGMERRRAERADARREDQEEQVEPIKSFIGLNPRCAIRGAGRWCEQILCGELQRGEAVVRGSGCMRCLIWMHARGA